jgi:predicted nucleotidyltransferase
MIDLMKQKEILFMAKYGSYNYNIANHNSDIDWRGFSNIIDENLVDNFEINNNDICINNIKYLYKALTEMQPKFIELLFSDTILISDNLTNNVQKSINDLFNMRNDIVIMDLPYMYINYLNEYYKHQQWIAENKYPNKNINYLIHSFRMLDILYRFAKSDFKDYKNAIYYNDEDEFRKIILKVKSGELSVFYFQNIIQKKLENILKIKHLYNKNVDLNTINKLKIIIKNINEEKGAMI